VAQEQFNVLAVTALVACWGSLALIWLVGAIYWQQAPAERIKRWSGSIGPIGWAIATVAFTVVPRADWGSLEVHTLWIRLAGLAILLAATAFAVWARLILGPMWSPASAVKEKHELRTSGPYGVTRHPIYTGKLGMMLGSFLLAGGPWILPFPIFLLLFQVKIRLEERLMLTEFPDDYSCYRQQVSQLIPGLRMFSKRRVATG
jgi:protein-S-isoprenylcysteine O-methyltransferase Ste14